MLDTPKKFQDDYERIDPVDIAIKKADLDINQTKSRTTKTDTVDEDKLEKLKEDTIF